MIEPTVQEMKQALVDMAVETWRFRGVFERAMSKLDAGEKNRYVGQFQWLIKKMEQALDVAGLRIVDVEGEMYGIGMAVTPFNIADFEEEDKLLVKQMIEPIIMSENDVVRMGTVVLERYE